MSWIFCCIIYICHKLAQNKMTLSSEIFESASFRRVYTRNWWGNVKLDISCWFQFRLRQKNGFCVFVDVHEMSINRCIVKSTPAQKKSIEVNKHLMAFFRTYVIALISIMCICFCSLQVFGLQLKSFASQKFKLLFP